MSKQAKVEIRCSPEEKERWQEAAGGPRKVSAWMRALANTAAEASPDSPDPVEVLVAEGAKVVTEKAKVPLSTDGMIGPVTALDAVGLELGASTGKVTSETTKPKQCLRWMHHRSGRYCGSCDKIIP